MRWRFSAWPLPDRGGTTTTTAIRYGPRCNGPSRSTSGARAKRSVATAVDCGVEINLYIRAKIGFCNCTTGVSDDDELDRLSDFNLMGDKPSVLGPGHPIGVAWMKGRSRAYTAAGPFRTEQSALAIAFNDHCDAIVATVVVAHDRPAVIEPSVLAFLNSKTILGWAEVTLGL